MNQKQPAPLSVLALPVIVAISVAISACSKSESAAPVSSVAKQATSGGDLTWGVTTEPACFDPHRSSQQNSFWVIRNFIDSLISKRTDGTYAPWLAKSWSIADDGKSYTFNLRDDVKFTDGTPFNGEAVKANFDYILKNVSTTSSSASLLVNFDRVDVVSPYVVKLVMKQPDSTTLESLSSVKLGFISPKALAENKDLCGGGPGIVGTGPFVFKSYQRGQQATFERNPDYQWAPGNAAHHGPAYLQRVTYRFLPESAVRTGALSSGQVDLIEGVQPTDIPVFDKVDGFQYVHGPSATTSFTLNINYTVAPATDVRVRRALRDGFDLDAIVKSVYLGTVQRAWSNIGPDNPDYNRSLAGSWGNNVAAANKLLDEAGWTSRDSEGFRTKDGKRLTIEVGYPQPYVRDSRDVLIRAVQSALRQNIGLDLHLRITTAGDFANQKATGVWFIYPNTDNPSDVAMELWDMLGDKGFLYSAIPNPDATIVGQINRARLMQVGDARRTLLGEIQKRAVDEAFIVPLFVPVYHLAAKSTVHGIGFEPQLDGPASAYDIWLDKRGA